MKSYSTVDMIHCCMNWNFRVTTSKMMIAISGRISHAPSLPNLCGIASKRSATERRLRIERPQMVVLVLNDRTDRRSSKKARQYRLPRRYGREGGPGPAADP